jgi:hypothetical protein
MPRQSRDQDLLPFVLERRERIDAKIARGQGCWPWLGARDTRGYGQITVNASRTMRAHRAVWMLRHGKTVPADMTLDHLCRNPSCVNPQHLEPVTFDENVRRAARAREGGASIRERITVDGTTRYVVLFREEVDGRVRQRSRTFGSQEAAEQHRQLVIDKRFTALPHSVWETA